jgi:3-deoxy-manno-octulosonate cytidylyltransferase (CMP-KDO synthetase)
MKILGIIPARYASTRFPGKPLAMIGDKSMIERVYIQCIKSNLTDVFVATDDERIYKHVKTFGKVKMTGDHHQSGTDRCQEVVEKMGDSFDYVINIQGDEPFINPEQINLLASLLDGKTEIATLVKKIERPEQLFNPNVVKAVRGVHHQALYFSRSPVPYVRGKREQEWLNNHTFFKHIGMYAYRTDILKKITDLKPTTLEKTESLEQLRWLESGFSILTAETHLETFGIDSPEDLKQAEIYWKTLQPGL